MDGRLEGEIEITDYRWDIATSPYGWGSSGLCPNREFEGRIDEAMVLPAGWNPEEIAAMFEAGKPGQSVRARPTSNDK